MTGLSEQETKSLVSSLMAEVRLQADKADSEHMKQTKEWLDRLVAIERRAAGGGFAGPSVKDLLLEAKEPKTNKGLADRPANGVLALEISSKAILGITSQISQWTGQVSGTPEPAFGVRGLIPIAPTTQGAVTILRETAFTNAAAGVAEGTTKPQAAGTYTPLTIAAVTIAQYLKLSKQTYNDLPQLVSALETKLLWGLAKEEERQLLKGLGPTNPNELAGLYLAAQPLAGTPPSGATYVDVIGMAIGQLSNGGYTATGIVVNGTDWQNALLLKTATNEYIMGGPATFGPKQPWGVKVVVSPHLGPGEWLVGAFPQGATLYERESVGIQLAAQNEDDFIKNMVTALAEQLEALVIGQPGAFVKNAAAGSQLKQGKAL